MKTKRKLDDHATPRRRALLVLDVQEGLVARKLYDSERFLSTISEAISRTRKDRGLVVHIRHGSGYLKPGSPGWELYSGLDRCGDDPVVDKRRGDAFEETDLSGLLEENGVSDVVVCGLVTHGCVRATCLGGKAAQFRVSLLRGGHTSWARDAPERIEATERELAAAGIRTVGLAR